MATAKLLVCFWGSRSNMKHVVSDRHMMQHMTELEPSSILDQKIREFSKKTQDVSVDEFKDYFWQLFRMASNTNNLEMCKNLLRAVPNALKDEKDVHFQSLEPSGKSPLHFSVADHFHQLGQWLFETYPREMKFHCLMQDHHGRIPLDYMEPRKALQPHQEGATWATTFFVLACVGAFEKKPN